VKEPVWLSTKLVVAIHDRQLRVFGGAPGLRDVGALESALGRPRNKFLYENAALGTAAAAYAYGLVKNHPFVDGNKRVALLAIVTFLGLNDCEFVAPEAEAVVMIRDLASGNVNEQQLALWIENNMRAASG
jgi:death-on-curing protein